MQTPLSTAETSNTASDKISATMVFDVATMMPAYRWHWRSQRWRSLLTLLVIFAALTTVIGCILGFTPKIFFISIGGAVGGVTGGLISKRLYAKRQLKRVPSYGDTFFWVFSSEFVSVMSSASEAKVAWERIFRTIVTPDGVLIYPQKSIFWWLPRTAFESDSNYAGFTELIASHTKWRKLA